MTPQPCRVTIVGAGNMAREHARAFRDVQGVRLAGIHSRTRAKAEALAAEFGIEKVCDSVEELYEKTQADLVVVTVRELSANAVSRACFKFSWTVLLEKPAGYNLEDARDIQSAARGRKVFVALNRWFLSSTRAALADLSARSDARFIHAQDQQHLATVAAGGEAPDVVRNWMFANSIHVIDYFRMFGRGAVERVNVISPWNDGRASIVLAYIQWDSGDTGLYEGLWEGPGPWAVSVTTAARRWEMRPLEQARVQNFGERTQNAADVHPWDQEFKPGFRRQAEEAVRAALGQPSECVTLDQAMQTMTLIQAIFA